MENKWFVGCKPTKAGGTSGHATTSKLWAYFYAMNPKVKKVTMDLGYKRLGVNAQRSFKYGPRPDIGVQFNNGTTLGIEIKSNTDIISKLKSRNNNFFDLYGIDGSVKVKNPFFIFKYIKAD